ncbi:alpha/beta hydrolase [Corynebacterium choanae]|uniref:Aminoacrylate hydrolase RutD n=1 Tax=Corynebacterium choanae TaxID=1862358 RepID=A0A3G6J410_9CORY|nr:alpha/beta fold hydrolase [Corynebacterium choanae]AZA12669.1 Putative aminoacrylate hydrolase RutD [Corynebacterium choanae]
MAGNHDRAPVESPVAIGTHIAVRYTPHLFLDAHTATVAQRPDADAKTYDAQVHVVTFGNQSNPAIVLLSGLSVPWFDWQQVAEELARDHYVVVFDRIGSGLSTATDGHPPGTLASEVDIVAQVMAATGIDKAHLVAHSMAGFIGEAFALIYPARTTRLTLLDGSYEPKTTGSRAIIERLWHDTRTPGLVEKLDRFVLDIDAARIVFAHAWQLVKPGRDTPLRGGTDRRLMVRLAATEQFVDGMLRELRGYELWAEELALIDRTLPLRGDTVVVAACQGWANFGGRILGRWQRKLRRHARGLATRNQDATVFFLPIQASHLMMRDNSTAIIRILRATTSTLQRYHVTATEKA